MMAKTMTCDLCGHEVKPGRSGWLRVMVGLDTEQIDLCKECGERLIDPAVWAAVVSFVHDAVVTPPELRAVEQQKGA